MATGWKMLIAIIVISILRTIINERREKRERIEREQKRERAYQIYQEKVEKKRVLEEYKTNGYCEYDGDLNELTIEELDKHIATTPT